MGRAGFKSTCGLGLSAKATALSVSGVAKDCLVGKRTAIPRIHRFGQSPRFGGMKFARAYEKIKTYRKIYVAIRTFSGTNPVLIEDGQLIALRMISPRARRRLKSPGAWVPRHLSDFCASDIFRDTAIKRAKTSRVVKNKRVEPCSAQRFNPLIGGRS